LRCHAVVWQAALGNCALGYLDIPIAGGDFGWGRRNRPVINLTWEDAQRYTAWLSRITGKAYRLLTEAEYEYATRAETQTTYPWGDDIKLKGEAMANCKGCGGEWDGRETAPVGSFAPNKFGLYDVVGNVSEFVQDCWHNDYRGAPIDGSAWVEARCDISIGHVNRGGGLWSNPDQLRSAYRNSNDGANNNSNTGFRVARTLDVP
jgi:formylglycine-generating enzyme required for sulfatase activity